MRKLGGNIVKILPFAVIAAFITVILASGKEMSVETVLSYIPDNAFLAWFILLAMYALKSLSVVFPVVALQIAAGIIFPFWIALILNVAGVGITYTIPYIIGRISGTDTAEKLMKKYPKMNDAIMFQRNSNWFISFILRAVSCLPGDIVSMYLGSIGISYTPYLIASVAGTLPGLIPATFVGMNILNPKSTGFIVSLSITILSSVISIVVYYVIRNRKRV